MTKQTYTESANFALTRMSHANWNKKMAEIRKQGSKKSAALRKDGHAFAVEILAPREVGTNPTPLAAVVLDLDWKVAANLEMVESARDLITNAYALDSLDAAFPTVMKAMIEGRSLYEYGIGEFFLLYGKFEGSNGVQGRATKQKMASLIGGDERYMKPYTEHGRERLDPLPYAVRNILSHAGHNPNTLDKQGNELRTSIELLRQWTSDSKK